LPDGDELLLEVEDGGLFCLPVLAGAVLAADDVAVDELGATS
jgi:hypothetical protein